MGQTGTNDRSLAAGLEAALAWWREAGVDLAFVDAPQDWLEAQTKPAAGKAPAVAALPPLPPKPPSISAQPAETAPIAADRSEWPETFENFAPWWLTEPTLAPRGAKRLPPVGPKSAPLMVLVPMPAEDDGDTLLSGRTGLLLDAMLTAMGLDPASIYRAAALPARIALPDWAGLGAAGLGAVRMRHVLLAAPQRLLVFGRNDISALLAHGPTQNAHDLRVFNHESGTVPAGFEYDLETLLAKPGWKAGVWQRWLDEAACAGTGR